MSPSRKKPSRSVKRKPRASKSVSKTKPKAKKAAKSTPVKPAKKTQKPSPAQKASKKPAAAKNLKNGVLFAFIFIVGVVLFIVSTSEPADPAAVSATSDLPSHDDGSSSYTYGGFPVNHTGDNTLLVLTNQAFAVGYSEARHNPLWVAYRFQKAPVLKNYSRHSGFMVDDRTQSRVAHADYTNSGFDRGHMAPSYGIAECYGDSAMVETYMMSNIAPQTPRLNREIWRNLESKIVREYADDFEMVWVITGPIFDSNIERLESGVEIPDAYFKIVADEQDGQLRLLGFIIPQTVGSNASLDHYIASVDEIEGQTGLDFFSLIPDEFEDLIELRREASVW